MRGHQRRGDYGEPEQLAGEQAVPVQADQADQGAAGPIPDVGPTGEGGGGHQTASEQAYGVAVPRTTPSKRGKDPKYKKKDWATQRQFDQLTDDQRFMLDDLAKRDAERRAVPRGSVPIDDAIHQGIHEAIEDTKDAIDELTGKEDEPSLGAEMWGSLDAHRRAGFLNITAAMRGNHIPTSGVRLAHAGIHRDRLLFTSDSGPPIKAALDNAIAHRKTLGNRGFKRDKPEEGMHPGMAEWGGRQCVVQASMQIGGGSAGVFIDIDSSNPKQGALGGFFGGLWGHIGEVLMPGKTDPFKIARELDERGDDP